MNTIHKQIHIINSLGSHPIQAADMPLIGSRRTQQPSSWPQMRKEAYDLAKSAIKLIAATTCFTAAIFVLTTLVLI